MQIAKLPVEPKEKEIRTASLAYWQGLKIEERKEGCQEYRE